MPEPFRSWDFIPRARGDFSLCRMTRCTLEKDHQGSGAEAMPAEHVIKHNCEGCQGRQRSLCQSAGWTDSRSPGVTDGRLSQLPAPVLAPSWGAVQKLSLSQATATPSSYRRPGDPFGDRKEDLCQMSALSPPNQLAATGCRGRPSQSGAMTPPQATSAASVLRSD